MGHDRSDWWVFGDVISTATPAPTSTAPSMVIYDIERGSAISVFEGASGDTMMFVERSMDGRFLVGNVGHPGDYRVELVDLRSGAVTVLFRGDVPQRALISPDSCHVAVGTAAQESSEQHGELTTIFLIDGTQVVQLDHSELVGWAPGLG
jgi:hypothetical protein